MLMELSRREKAANIKPDADIDAFMKARSRRPGKKSPLMSFFLSRNSEKLQNNLIIKLEVVSRYRYQFMRSEQVLRFDLISIHSQSKA
jgi:hypothetical protein